MILEYSLQLWVWVWGVGLVACVAVSAALFLTKRKRVILPDLPWIETPGSLATVFGWKKRDATALFREVYEKVFGVFLNHDTSPQLEESLALISPPRLQESLSLIHNENVQKH